MEDKRNKVEQVEATAEDPFIETEKKILALEKDVATLKQLVNEKDKTINMVIATNKQLLTELNNVPQKPVSTVNKNKVMEETFFKSLGIKEK